MMNTKISKLLLSGLLILPIFISQVEAAPAQPKPHTAVKTLRGEAIYRERIALPPDAILQVSLVGRVAGADASLSTASVPARNGITPFEMKLPVDGVPPGPYLVRARIVGDFRVLFRERAPLTVIYSLGKKVKIQLGSVAAPSDNNSIGDGTKSKDNITYHLGVDVFKLDRRALTSDAKIVLEVRDITLSDTFSTVLGSLTAELRGKQLPITFDWKFRSLMDPKGRYTVSARVFEGGKVHYVTAASHSLQC